MEALGTILAGWSDAWAEDGIFCIPGLLLRLIVVLFVLILVLPMYLVGRVLVKTFWR